MNPNEQMPFYQAPPFQPSNNYPSQSPNTHAFYTLYQHNGAYPQLLTNQQPQLASPPANYHTHAQQYHQNNTFESTNFNLAERPIMQPMAASNVPARRKICNEPYTHQSSPQTNNTHSQSSSISNRGTQQTMNSSRGFATRAEAEGNCVPLASRTTAAPPAPDPQSTSCPNIRQVNSILRRLAKDRAPPEPASSQELAPVPHNGNDTSLPNEQSDSVLRLIPTPHDREEPTENRDQNTNTAENDSDNNTDDRLIQLPDDVMEEIICMELDELRENEALHAKNKRLPAYLKAKLDDMYYEFERQLHILAIRHQLHATLLYTHIGQTNRMRGATNYNNFCRFDPQAREIFSTKDEPLKQRCKEVGKLWSTMDPDIKMQYKDPTFIESICGDVPMTVVNGVIQTVKKRQVASSTLTLASEKKSITFVRRWAKETIDRMNEIAACHNIQGILVIASGRSSGDLFIQGGTKMGVSFLDLLVGAGDPLRKFHTYAAGMSVIAELTNGNPDAPRKTHPTRKRKQPEANGNAADEDQDQEEEDQYCRGQLRDNKAEISRKLVKILNAAGGKKFAHWPGKNAASVLPAAGIQVKIKAQNKDNFIASELFQPVNALSIVTSQRILRAIGEGWIKIQYNEEEDEVNPSNNNDATQEKQPPPNSKPRKNAAKRAKIKNKDVCRKQRKRQRSNEDSDEEEPLQDSDDDSNEEDPEYDQTDSSEGNSPQ
ncbi:hypothetical protein PCASD_18707 [Puccinia coronata f. sp. avenae]|uniref:Uncharacterized protein n=1 Tax=Puccinia coronata f. sp. avenae TaxID=200324 RepID=A0A2N5SSV3_9BASI|nr:hypothetical protein PCASD_18707 [Puccinia coronata f. sp. avenae]